MSKLTIQEDFPIQNPNSRKCPSEKKPLERRKSFKEIQNAISRIDPKLLKAIIASRTGNGEFESKSTENGFSHERTLLTPKTPCPEPPPKKSKAAIRTPLPAFAPVSMSSSENVSETAPLTIFYNGAVCVYDVPQNMAERILKLAEKVNIETVKSADTEHSIS